MNTMIRMLFAGVALATAAAAHAKTCEEDFSTIGDARNGMAYGAARVVPGLSATSAIGQIEGITKAQGFELGAANLKGTSGELYFMQNGLSTPLVVLATADRTGRVALTFKLARGQSMAPDSARTNLCGILNQVKGGAAGDALARAGDSANPANGVTVVEAPKLSQQLRKDVGKAMAAANTMPLKDMLLGTNTPRNERTDVNASFRPILVRYLGRRYRIDGQINTLSASYGTMRIDYLVAPKRGLLQIQQQQGPVATNYFPISCELASDQRALFSTLEERSFVKLEGVVDRIDEGSMTLRDCRQVN